MIDKKQSRRYSSLHDRLGKVYDLKEENGEGMIALSETMEELHKRFSGEWEDFKATAKTDNLVDKAAYESRDKETAAFLENWGDFMKRIMPFIESNAIVHQNVIAAMEDMMKQNKRLSESPLSRAKIDETLDRLEKTIAQVEEDMQDSVAALLEYEKELDTISHSYAEMIARFAQPDMPFEVFFGMEKDSMPEEVRKQYEENYDIYHFFSDVFKPWHSEAKEKLEGLTQELYYDCLNPEQPTIRRYIDSVNAQSANDLILKLFALVKEGKEGIVMEEKYGKEKIDRWKEFYCRPQPPHLLTDERRNDYKYLTDEEWEAKMASENNSIRMYHNWEEKRKEIWYDAMQPLNFTYLPQLNDMEGDYWIVYAMEIRDEYERWKTRMEHVETVLDYRLDPELLFASRDEFTKAHTAVFQQYWKEEDNKRNQRIQEDMKKYGMASGEAGQ